MQATSKPRPTESRKDLTRSIWLAENIHPYEEDPRVYGGYLRDSVYLLLTQPTLGKETNIANCLARMEQIPRVVAAAKDNLRHPARPLLAALARQPLLVASLTRPDTLSMNPSLVAAVR